MPHLPDSQHPDHDLELIAAYAAGDATGSELDRATALVATCEGCAALHHDLRSIAAAMPAMPAPARTRDFRLTPEQAAELRPRGLRGLLATLSGPRFSFATPVGTGLAALGIVGVLVASGGLPVGGAGTAAPQPEAAATQNDQPAPGAAGAMLASEAPASAAPEAEAPAASAAASSAPLAELPSPVDGASPAVDTMGGAEEETSADPAAAASEAPASEGTELYMTADASGDPSRQSGVMDPAESPDTIQAISGPTAPVESSATWLPAAVLLFGLGVALVLLRWGARRLA
jgi:hypothetical protein